MKKLLFAALLMIGGGNFAFGAQEIPMQIINKGGAAGGNTLAPARPWYIIQDGYELTLPAFEDDYTLELRDATDTVVYSSYVATGTTQVVLPSTLSGSFELRLVPFFATYYYRGYITL